MQKYEKNIQSISFFAYFRIILEKNCLSLPSEHTLSEIYEDLKELLGCEVDVINRWWFDALCPREC